MKLNHNETIVKEYFFNNDKAVLTTNRLVFFNNTSEENYPLSKITSVKIEKIESDFRKKVLGFAVVGLVLLFIITLNQTISYDIALVVFLFLIYAVYFGFQPDKITTNLVINQFGGIKKYTVLHNKNLQIFIDEVNKSLV